MTGESGQIAVNIFKWKEMVFNWHLDTIIYDIIMVHLRFTSLQQFKQKTIKLKKYLILETSHF